MKGDEERRGTDVREGKVFGSLEEFDDVELGLRTVSDLLDDDLDVGLGLGRGGSRRSSGRSTRSRSASRGGITSSSSAHRGEGRVSHGKVLLWRAADLGGEEHHQLVQLDGVELGHLIGELDDVRLGLEGIERCR